MKQIQSQPTLGTSLLRSPIKLKPLSKDQPSSVSSIFADMSFCFPVLDTVLSPKLVELLKQKITANGGEVFQLGFGGKWSKPHHYYLVSEKANLTKLGRTVNELAGNLLEFSYIKECLTSGKLLPVESFMVQVPEDSKKAPPTAKPQEISMTQSMVELATVAREAPKATKRQRQPSAQRAISTNRPTKQPRVKVTEVFGLHSDFSSEDFDIQAPISSPENSRRRNQKEYWDAHKHEFVCQQKPAQLTRLLPTNEFVCEQLSRLQKIYEVEKDLGRSCAYRRAIAAVKTLTTDIQQRKDLQQLKGVGPKILDKIMEIVETGRLGKLEKLQKDGKYKAVEELGRVWGIGPATATEFYNDGITTIEQLKGQQHRLNKNQRIGLKYLQEFEQRIPRDQATQIIERVKNELEELVGVESLHDIEACGSYRRGKETCGDIDIIITRRDGTFQPELIFALVQKLEEVGLLTDHLNMPHRHTQPTSFSYMGVCLHRNVHRRLDIKYYPLEQYAYALLYFTGSDYFNRSMRLFARKKGYSLSDHSLTPVERTTGMKQVWQGRNIVCFTEKDIFEFLGLDYMKPEDRNV